MNNFYLNGYKKLESLAIKNIIINLAAGCSQSASSWYLPALQGWPSGPEKCGPSGSQVYSCKLALSLRMEKDKQQRISENLWRLGDRLFEGGKEEKQE